MVTDTKKLRRAWAGVFIRENRLIRAVDSFVEVRQEFDGTPFRVPQTVDDLHAFGRLAEELTYRGEVVLMFADAATNVLAEAMARSLGIDSEFSRPPSLRSLRRKLEGGRAASLAPDMSGYLKRIARVEIAVNIPRHSLAVHPPLNASANTFTSWGDGVLYMGGWAEPWSPEAEDWIELQKAILTEIEIPDDRAGVRDRLIEWVVDRAERLELSDESLEQLEDHIRKHGCSVSPERTASTTRNLIRDLAVEFGYSHSDFFSQSD